jgi:hypothetical protein
MFAIWAPGYRAGTRPGQAPIGRRQSPATTARCIDEVEDTLVAMAGLVDGALG